MRNENNYTNSHINRKIRKHRKTTFFRRFILISILLIVFIVLYNNYARLIFARAEHKVQNIINTNSKNSGYDTIKLDQNSNYNGIGQTKVSGKDGYFTTFTTNTENKKVYKEYKQNGTSSWSNKNYWDGTMETSGCGITAMSIILSGYGKSFTPEDLRKEYYPVLNGDYISKELSNTFGISNTDFYYDSVHLSNNNLQKHLRTNRPILICVWNKPRANRWTTGSHYMVLLACDNNNMVYISNPNGLENCSKSSGWYDINEVSPYIAKALFIEKS